MPRKKFVKTKCVKLKPVKNWKWRLFGEIFQRKRRDKLKYKLQDNDGTSKIGKMSGRRGKIVFIPPLKGKSGNTSSLLLLFQLSENQFHWAVIIFFLVSFILWQMSECHLVKELSYFYSLILCDVTHVLLSFGNLMRKKSSTLGKKFKLFSLDFWLLCVPLYRKQIALWTQELGATGARRAFRRAYPEVGRHGAPTRYCCYYNLKRLLDTEDLSFENKVCIIVQCHIILKLQITFHADWDDL